VSRCGFGLGALWLACALTPFGCAPRPEGSLTLASTRPLALSAEILATGVHGASCVPAGLFDPPRVGNWGYAVEEAIRQAPGANALTHAKLYVTVDGIFSAKACFHTHGDAVRVEPVGGSPLAAERPSDVLMERLPRVAPVFFDLSGYFSVLSTRALSLPIERRSEVMVEVCAAYDKGMQKTVETAIAKTSDANAVMNASVEVSPLGCHRVKGIAVRLPSP